MMQQQPTVDRNIVPEIAQLHINPETAEAHSVWRSLLGNLINGSPAEVGYVRGVISDAVIEKNDRMREEIASLLNIVQDMRVERLSKPAAVVASQVAGEGSLARPSLSGGGGLLRRRLDQAASFSEHTASREQETLKSRLQLLLFPGGGNQAADASPSSTDSSAAPTPHVDLSARERQVAEFLVTGRPASAVGRPTSRSSATSSADWARPSSRRSDASSRASYADPAAALKPMSQCLGWERVREVAADIRELFAEEYELLVQDADSVREWIEEEISWQRFVPPTVVEIKTLSKKIEKLESDVEHAQRIRSLPDAAAAPLASVAGVPSSAAVAASLSLQHSASMVLPVSPAREPTAPSSLAPKGSSGSLLGKRGLLDSIPMRRPGSVPPLS